MPGSSKQVVKYLDDLCYIGKPVQWYLMTSYLYYNHDISIISDKAYDNLCRRLLNGINGFEEYNHPHTSLIDVDALVAGSGFHLKEDDYPSITKNAAKMFARNLGYDIK